MIRTPAHKQTDPNKKSGQLDMRDFGRAKTLGDIIDRAQKNSSEYERLTKGSIRPVERSSEYMQGYAKGWADAWYKIKMLEGVDKP